MDIVAFATHIFSILTIVAQATVLLIIISLFFHKKARKILLFFGNNAIVFSFIVALVATLGSLFYSEIAGYTPCKLCWYQRILMYPQVLLLGMAYLKKDKQIGSYSILLSFVGASIALYHYLIQRGTIGEILPCSAVGYSVSCAKTFVMTYGYVTTPLMALSAFLLILFLFVAQKKTQRRRRVLIAE